MYNFATVYSRNNKASEKWDTAVKQGCPEGIAPLTVADMEFRTAPEIIDAVKELAEFGLWGYTYGDDEFNGVVAQWLNQYHGGSVTPEWVVNTAGVIPALNTAVRAFTKIQDEIIIQTPVYGPFFSAVKNNERILVESKLIIKNGRYEMDIEDFREKAKTAKMYILCSPHNPVGRVWTKEELLEVLDICCENQVLVVADEIHFDIITGENPHTSILSLPEKYQGNWVVCTSASKTFSLAGLNCASTLIADETLRKKFNKQIEQQNESFNSAFGVQATKAAYQKGRKWLEELLPYIRKNYEILKQFLQEYLPEAILYPMEGTYLAWVDLRCLAMSEKETMKFLREEALLYVTNGTAFGKEGSGHVRINLACPQSVLKDGLTRLEKAVLNRSK